MSFTIHTKETAPAKSKSYMEALEQKVGFIPNIIGAVAESPTTIAAVVMINQALEHSNFTPVEQRIVTITASIENSCSYCVPAQSTMAQMSEMPEETLAQLRARQTLSDEKFEALQSFTLKVIHNKGWVPEQDVQTFIAAGYETSHVLEVITLVAYMTLTNYVGHITSVPLDGQFESQSWQDDDRKIA